ncbi:MAG TPA: hypothetical protein VGR03_09230 [Candidatus Acidoferrum sp.]|nr:hypothetical protein [Candidatus Acidoferrum sp.]
MSYDTKILILVFAGSFPLAVLYLYLKDFLYTKTTGRPASQRYRERVVRWYGPLTRRKYIAFCIFLGLTTLLSAYSVGWSGEYRGWSKLSPLIRMIFAAFLLFFLQKRWRKQQAGLNDQPSGAARK